MTHDLRPIRLALAGLALACAATAHGATTESLDALKDALLCRGNPQGAVQRAAKHASLDAGVLVGAFGDGAQARTVFLLRDPLHVGGGPTQTIVHELTPSTPGFNGIVYGRFSGGHREVVKDLKLKPLAPGARMTVGAFERALDKDVLGRKDAACPKTIGLTPLPQGGFLLGCGWCSG